MLQRKKKYEFYLATNLNVSTTFQISFYHGSDNAHGIQREGEVMQQRPSQELHSSGSRAFIKQMVTVLPKLLS